MKNFVSVTARGELILQDEPASELLITDDGEILSDKLKAGERLGTMLERKRNELGMSIEDLVKELPIRESAYKGIEDGYNVAPPDDVIEAIAEALKLDPDELKKLASLDKSDPVTYYPEPAGY